MTRFARRPLEEHLKRVEWDEWKFPVRLYPFVSTDTPAPRTIAIDPKIAFGALRARGVSRVYFTDRDLGKRFPDILTAAGLAVERHHALFPPDGSDEQWLEHCGRNGSLWMSLFHSFGSY